MTHPPTRDIDTRPLLAMLRVLANEDETPNAGLVSRFYKCLAASSTSPTPDHLRDHVVRALEVAGRPPIHSSRHAESALCSATSHPDAELAALASQALIQFWRTSPPTNHDLPRELVARASIPMAVRIEAAVHTHDDDVLRQAIDLTSRSESPTEAMLHAQDVILTRAETRPLELELLEALYMNGSWLGRRIMLRQLGPGHEHLVPTLARVASRADPTTQRAVISALERIGHVSAEPVLLALLSDLEPGVLSDVVSALGRLGTRACLPRLSELRDQHPELAESVDAAFSLLDQRFPVDARAGAISLAEEGPAGALSLANASPGDVSLYRSVEQKLTEQALVERPSEIRVSEWSESKHWLNIRAAPRDLSWSVQLYLLGWGEVWPTSALMWAVVTLNMPVFFQGVGVGTFATGGIQILGVAMLVFVLPMLIVSMMFSASIHPVGTLSALARGRPSIAKLTDERGPRNSPRAFVHYFDDEDRLRETEVPYYEHRHVGAQTREAVVLYIPESGKVRFVETLPDLRIDERGRLTVTPWMVIGGLLGPLAFAIMLITHLVHPILEAL